MSSPPSIPPSEIVGPSGSSGGPSRRDTGASTSSASSSRGERAARAATGSHPAVESAVTRLLVAIKQLLEALTLWSQLKMDEQQVSDVYVRLGNDFNSAVTAFSAFGIDMVELKTVPDDLRTVLEQCLAEDATHENLELYLPDVRQIITSLLQGLRAKQSIYRRIVSDHRHRSSEQAASVPEHRSSRSSRREGGGHRSQLSRTVTDPAERPVERDSLSRRSGMSGRRRDAPTSTLANVVNGDERFVGGFAAEPSSAAAPPPPDRNMTPPPPPPSMPVPGRSHSKPRSQRPTETLPPPPPPPLPPPIQKEEDEIITSPVQPIPAIPASMKRYSLVDKPSAPLPDVVVEPSSPDPSTTDRPERQDSATPPLDALQAPAMANSLAALKKSDALERRASKRFSTYNISKMTGGSTTRDRSVRGHGHPSRRSLVAGAGALTAGDLAVLTEVDDEETHLKRESSSRSRRTAASRPVTPEERNNTVPPLPTTPARTPEPASPSQEAETIPVKITPPVDHQPTRISVFLQLGREVKKATIDPGLSFPSLRVLFVDKFSYNPGQENFPAIYIRDPSSGVQYELEDVEEVKNGCLLSLNIEPLDQIKQHIDAKIANLSQDIKDLKGVVSSNKSTASLSTIVGQAMDESTPSAPRPTDSQWHNVARRLSRFAPNSIHSPSTPTQPMPILGNAFPPQMFPQLTAQSLQPQMTGQTLQSQMTGGSVLSEYSSRVVSDLKTQFDEVQNLRRDLGIMRQLYTEFMKTTKESLGAMRGQTQSVKQLANTGVGGARGYIDSGKKRLDTRSQNVLTEVEKLQDTVEMVKEDVLKRHVTPKVQYFKGVKKDIDTVAAELESLKEHIKTIKPMWKKTWEEELQNIVEEQQFLTHQEEFLSDLLEDHKAVLEVYGHVEKVINLRGGSGPSNRIMPRNRSYRPPPPEEGHNGLSTVMLEIKGASVDAEKRMKAIEANQKNREKELASRSDELQAELISGSKKLKMTGGAEEAERVRQKRNDMTLKAMFTGGDGE